MTIKEMFNEKKEAEKYCTQFNMIMDELVKRIKTGEIEFDSQDGIEFSKEDGQNVVTIKVDILYKHILQIVEDFKLEFDALVENHVIPESKLEIDGKQYFWYDNKAREYFYNYNDKQPVYTVFVECARPKQSICFYTVLED